MGVGHSDLKEPGSSPPQPRSLLGQSLSQPRRGVGRGTAGEELPTLPSHSPWHPGPPFWWRHLEQSAPSTPPPAVPLSLQRRRRGRGAGRGAPASHCAGAHLALGRADKGDVGPRPHALHRLLLHGHRDGLAWSLWGQREVSRLPHPSSEALQPPPQGSAAGLGRPPTARPCRAIAGGGRGADAHQ